MPAGFWNIGITYPRWSLNGKDDWDNVFQEIENSHDCCKELKLTRFHVLLNSSVFCRIIRIGSSQVSLKSYSGRPVSVYYNTKKLIESCLDSPALFISVSSEKAHLWDRVTIIFVYTEILATSLNVLHLTGTRNPQLDEADDRLINDTCMGIPTAAMINLRTINHQKSVRLA